MVGVLVIAYILLGRVGTGAGIVHRGPSWTPLGHYQDIPRKQFVY